MANTFRNSYGNFAKFLIKYKTEKNVLFDEREIHLSFFASVIDEHGQEFYQEFGIKQAFLPLDVKVKDYISFLASSKGCYESMMKVLGKSERKISLNPKAPKL